MDERKRGLERDALHGDPSARARVIAERFRSGETTEQRVRLAAFLGDAVAAQAFPDTTERGGVPKNAAGFEKWVSAIQRIGGDEALSRVALVVGRIAQNRYESWYQSEHPNAIEDDERLRRCVEAAEEYVLDPDEWAQRALLQAQRTAEAVSRDLPNRANSMVRAHSQMISDLVANPSSAASLQTSLASYFYGLRSAIEQHAPIFGRSERAQADEARQCQYAQNQIMQELLPWALGDGDPVRDRVEVRERERVAKEAKKAQDQSAEQARAVIDDMDANP